MNDLILIRADDVAARLGESRSKLSLDVRAGLMPPPVRNGKLAVWPAYEVDAVAHAVIAGATDDELRSLARSLVERRAAGKPTTAAA